MKTLRMLLAFVIVMSTCVVLSAQETPWLQWTFLSQEIMDEIIGEASGETAWNTIVETGGYNKDRLAEEYAGIFYEADYIFSQLKLYGLPGAEIARFPASGGMFGGSGETWDGIKGELWEVKPKRRKLASYQDLRAMLATGSSSADVTAELVWVGSGTEAEIKQAGVEGKIVVTEGRMFRVHQLACRKMGAEGVVVISQSRPDFDSLQIPWSGVRGWRGSGQPTKFGFFLPFREGIILKRRLLAGEKITVHALVEAKMEAYELQCPTCHIPGTDPNAGEVIFSAHLFEGYAKQGANDNKSGSATILEVARVLHKLIEEGRIPRPKRTIRFLWAPEFSGTIPWVNANKEIMERTLCNINMDMVGEWLIKNKAYAVLTRTTYGNPHYVNDVMENYYRFMGESNKNHWPQGVPRRIVAPSGADEPFYYYVETHTGGSDHEVFNDWGVRVPGVSMSVWPDQWYHTSGDRADKADPTQLKRAAIIGAAGAYTIASADDEMALKIAAEVTGNGTRRLGHKLDLSLNALNNADSDTLSEAYRMARIYIEAAVANEQDTLDTILELAAGEQRVGDFVAEMKGAISEVGLAHQKIIDARMRAVAARLNTQPVKVELSDLERTASGIVYKTTAKVKELGALGSMRAFRDLPAEDREKYPVSRGAIANTSELSLLVNGKRSVLDIKNMLDAQYERKSDLQAVINYLELLELAGLVEEVF